MQGSTGFDRDAWIKAAAQSQGAPGAPAVPTVPTTTSTPLTGPLNYEQIASVLKGQLQNPHLGTLYKALTGNTLGPFTDNTNVVHECAKALTGADNTNLSQWIQFARDNTPNVAPVNPPEGNGAPVPAATPDVPKTKAATGPGKRNRSSDEIEVALKKRLRELSNRNLQVLIYNDKTAAHTPDFDCIRSDIRNGVKTDKPTAVNTIAPEYRARGWGVPELETAITTGANTHVPVQLHEGNVDPRVAQAMADAGKPLPPAPVIPQPVYTAPPVPTQVLAKGPGVPDLATALHSLTDKQLGYLLFNDPDPSEYLTQYRVYLRHPDADQSKGHYVTALRTEYEDRGWGVDRIEKGLSSAGDVAPWRTPGAPPAPPVAAPAVPPAPPVAAPVDTGVPLTAGADMQARGLCGPRTPEGNASARTLYIDCMPIAGSVRPEYAAILYASVMQVVANDAQVAHIGLMDYGKGTRALAAYATQMGWPPGVDAIYVSTHDTFAALAEVLAPMATVVIKKC